MWIGTFAAFVINPLLMLKVNNAIAKHWKKVFSWWKLFFVANQLLEYRINTYTPSPGRFDIQLATQWFDATCTDININNPHISWEINITRKKMVYLWLKYEQGESSPFGSIVKKQLFCFRETFNTMRHKGFSNGKNGISCNTILKKERKNRITAFVFCFGGTKCADLKQWSITEIGLCTCGFIIIMVCSLTNKVDITTQLLN